MLKKFNLHIKISVLFFLLSSGILKANNIAVSSGAWETGTNWSLGVPPIATDIVIVPAGKIMTVKLAGDVCKDLNIAATGSLIINTGGDLSISGNFSNAGTFTSNAGSTIIFNGAASSVITGGGTYSIAGTIVLNMASTAAVLDIQDANFIAGINSGGNYYISFTRGTWKMNNAGSLNDCYNTGSTNALTIPYGVVIESDAGTMNLCRNAPTGNAILSGELFLNGGTVNVQTGQGFNSGQDFQYHVNGGTPQLYLSAGTLNIGAGFNANAGSDFVDFHMTGGVMILAQNGYSNWITFQLADVVGGKTFMSGGTIILQDACNANIEDLDMGGANVALTQYSVTGGTVQLGYINTQSSSSYFGINAQPATNYPNIDFEAGVGKNVSAFTGGVINMLSLHVNANMTFDATGFSNVNIISNNGTFAFDDEGGFIQSTNTITFSGSVNQLITSNTLANEAFYNLTISNTSGSVTLGVGTTVMNQLTFTSGLLDASNYSLTLSTGVVPVTGASSGSYVVTGDGVTSTGLLNINNISANTSTIFPVGTATYYLPATINPGANTGNSYSAFVFQGTTTDATANGPAFSAGNIAKMLNAEWNINRTTGSGNAALTLNWTSSGTNLEGAAFQGYGLNIGISSYSGGSWQMATGNGNVSAQTATSTFNSFSQFNVVGESIVLPVLLSDFTAVLKNDQTVLLSWYTSEEMNIMDFEVQKSIDGLTWNTIGTVDAKDNFSTAGSYSLIDKNPATGVNYYRLLIQNTDGLTGFSPTRTVTINSVTGISVFPNPANNIVNISLDNAGAETNIMLINSMGQVLTTSVTGHSGNSTTSLNIRNYPSGIYFLRLESGEKMLKTSIVVIAH
jgi:Secretion system C-terminal sorting domain